MKSGIYSITCLINGKMYIGSSINLNKRWNFHIETLNKNIHHNKYLQRSWIKYKKENFDFNIIEYCEIKDLIEREQYYLDYMKPEFNICKIAGSSLGRICSEETKRKLSISQKDKIISIETRIKMSYAQSKTKENNKSRKLFSDEQIKEIRTIRNMTQKEIAIKYDSRQSIIGNIVNFKTYKDVK